MKVCLEGRLWVEMDENKRPVGYSYRRRLPFFEKGIRKYQDVRKVLGSNLDQARAEVKRLDSHYDGIERGEEPRRKATLGEFWKWYVNHIQEQGLLGWKTIKGNTWTLVAVLGEQVPMDRIMQSDVARFFENRKKEVSQATVHSCFRHVRRMFRVARENRFLDSDRRLPTDGLKVQAPRVTEPRLPDAGEVRILLDWLKKNRPWLYRVVLGLIFTGARTSELLGLTWDRVGFVKPEKDNPSTTL